VLLECLYSISKYIISRRCNSNELSNGIFMSKIKPIVIVVITLTLGVVHSFASSSAFLQSHSRIDKYCEGSLKVKSTSTLSMVQIENRLADLGIILPPAPKAAANYVPVQHTGNLLFLSGHLPILEDGKTLLTGRIAPNRNCDGDDHELLDHGYKAARQCGLNLISTLKEHLGDLDNVEKIVKIFGIVQSTNDFHEQHKVLNGCSDLMVEVFGNTVGVHARSAIGTNCLPLNISVEVEMIVQVKEPRNN
jgi:enamine deaminase RidA (YjgF/YER057c/UK114 family)